MIIQKGEKGPHVVLLQGILQKLNFALTSDGIFGDKTVDAVKEFQRISDLDVDGKVGPETANYLVRSLHFGLDEDETV